MLSIAGKMHRCQTIAWMSFQLAQNNAQYGQLLNGQNVTIPSVQARDDYQLDSSKYYVILAKYTFLGWQTSSLMRYYQFDDLFHVFILLLQLDKASKSARKQI